MKFYFCEKCGKRITDLQIAIGDGKDKKLNGVFCTLCAEGVLTLEMMPINERQALEILGKQDFSPSPNSSAGPAHQSCPSAKKFPTQPRLGSRIRPAERPNNSLGRKAIIVGLLIGLSVTAFAVALSEVSNRPHTQAGRASKQHSISRNTQPPSPGESTAGSEAFMRLPEAQPRENSQQASKFESGQLHINAHTQEGTLKFDQPQNDIETPHDQGSGSVDRLESPEKSPRVEAKQVAEKPEIRQEPENKRPLFKLSLDSQERTIISDVDKRVSAEIFGGRFVTEGRYGGAFLTENATAEGVGIVIKAPAGTFDASIAIELWVKESNTKPAILLKVGAEYIDPALYCICHYVADSKESEGKWTHVAFVLAEALRKCLSTACFGRPINIIVH